MRAAFPRLGVPAEVAQKLPDVDEKVLEPAFAAIRTNPQLNWASLPKKAAAAIVSFLPSGPHLLHTSLGAPTG